MTRPTTTTSYEGCANTSTTKMVFTCTKWFVCGFRNPPLTLTVSTIRLSSPSFHPFFPFVPHASFFFPLVVFVLFSHEFVRQWPTASENARRGEGKGETRRKWVVGWQKGTETDRQSLFTRHVLILLRYILFEGFYVFNILTLFDILGGNRAYHTTKRGNRSRCRHN